MARYDLNNKVVFITGASSGIGRACAVEFAKAGARVIVAARSKDKLDEVARDIGDERVLSVVMDVTKEEDRAAALRAARERFGPVDVLVNNAGWASFASVACQPMAHIEQMWRLNFLAPVAMIQAALPDMVARGSGQIINISSVVGHQAIPRMTVYSATKSALNALSTGLRMELRGSGVDVLLVAPGSTNTPFFTTAASVDVKAVRLGQLQYSPQRVARMIVKASRTRRRELTLTAAGRFICLARRFSHRLADFLIYQTSQRAMPKVSPEVYEAAGAHGE